MAGTANCFSSGNTYSDTIVLAFSGGDAGVVSTSNPNVCIGGTVSFQVSGNSSSIHWQSSNGIDGFVDIENATETTYSEEINQTTYYRVYTTGGGCSDTSNTIEITPQDPPSASFTYNQDTGYTVDFTSTSSNSSSYFWDFGNNSTSTEQNPSHTFPFEGTYPVKLVVSNSCKKDTTSINVIVLKLVGIESISANQLTILPNPFQETLNISITAPESFTLNIYNLLGQVVYSQFIPAQQGNSVQIDFSNKAPGVYTIQLLNKHGQLNKKVLKTD